MNTRDELAVARLRNFFHHRTPWQRSLWSIGTVTGILELLEYCKFGAEAGQSNEGMRYAAKALAKQVERDQGVGGEAVRSALVGAIAPFRDVQTGKGYPSEAERDRLRHFADRVSHDYLKRWSTAWDGPQKPEVEFASRCIAAHLLDWDFSASYLDNWLKRFTNTATPLASIIEEANSLMNQPKRAWTVCIPAQSAPARLIEHESWLDATATSNWLKSRSFPAPMQAGSMLVTVAAYDPWGAVLLANELFTRTQARARLGLRTSHPLSALGKAFVEGEPQTFQLQEPRRKVEIPNLSSSDAMGAVTHYGDAGPLDDAFELAATMYDSPPGPAITGGWAAIEGLLFRPRETGAQKAADRMAAIIACSFPRAELQTLSNTLARGTTEIGKEFSSLPRPRWARHLEELIGSGRHIQFNDHSDQAAFQRLQEMAARPGEVVVRVGDYVAGALRRLYNQRNIIMHSGRFQSCALATTIRTTPSLVGAGLDRITHGQGRAVPITALELAARAEIEIGLLGKPGGRSLSDLLA